MSKLSVDQKTVKALLQDKKSDFLIPDYQRPYEWGDTECQTLWNDVVSFAIPNEDASAFDDESEYFLGSIVTYQNNKRSEVIDGQQRLTTLMLLLRAFYERFKNLKDKQSVNTRRHIEKCIWKTDEFDEPDMQTLKIDSEVATDNDKEEFLEILRTGVVSGSQKSRYAQNFRFFEKSVNNFINTYPNYFAHLATRIMSNCILLPIEAESQDTALRIFSTLNDRGKSLSDADIFKAQFYKFFSSQKRKDDFISRWKELERVCCATFHPTAGTPMDEIFTRYMYFERAKNGIKSTTTEALRKYYERDSYAVLKREETFKNLEVLAAFWSDVNLQNEDRFSERVIRILNILRFAPNGMWTYFLSVYFMHNKTDDGALDEAKLYSFLSRATAFVWAYAVMHPGVNALRTPLFAEMLNIVHDVPVTFADYKFDASIVEKSFSLYEFTNNRPITKSMLAWWAFHFDDQPVISSDTKLEIEHIFARNRQEKERSLSDVGNLESLGNKSMLEERINIRASDYRFVDKKNYYKGTSKKAGTQIVELRRLSDEKSDFKEADIIDRKAKIIDAFVDYLRVNDLIK